MFPPFNAPALLNNGAARRLAITPAEAISALSLERARLCLARQPDSARLQTNFDVRWRVVT